MIGDASKSEEKVGEPVEIGQEERGYLALMRETDHASLCAAADSAREM